MLLKQIDKLEFNVKFKVIVIDYASTLLDRSYDELKEFNPKDAIKSIDILELDLNLGVDGAIHKGLTHAFINAKSKDLFW